MKKIKGEFLYVENVSDFIYSKPQIILFKKTFSYFFLKFFYHALSFIKLFNGKIASIILLRHAEVICIGAECNISPESLIGKHFSTKMHLHMHAYI